MYFHHTKVYDVYIYVSITKLAQNITSFLSQAFRLILKHIFIPRGRIDYL